MKQYYRFLFLPNIYSDSGGGFVWGVDFSEEFIEFAKTQELDHLEYEKNGKNILYNAGYRCEAINSLLSDAGSVYGWHINYSGLMVRASVPGNQENQLDFRILNNQDYRLCSHNIDDSLQFAASFALVNNWLNDILFRLDSVVSKRQ